MQADSNCKNTNPSTQINSQTKNNPTKKRAINSRFEALNQFKKSNKLNNEMQADWNPTKNKSKHRNQFKTRNELNNEMQADWNSTKKQIQALTSTQNVK